MNRGDLESKVQVTWERLNGRTDRCTGTLEVSSGCYVDWAIASLAGMPEDRFRAMVEAEVRRRLVSSVLAGLESENARLRAAVERWGRRAIYRQFPSRERRNEQDGEENELKEDLK